MYTPMVKLGIEIEEGKQMTKINVKTKKELKEKVSEYRKKGYMLVTFDYKLCEIEKGDELVVIEVER